MTPATPMTASSLFSNDALKKGRKESEQRRRVLMNQYYDELVILLSMISERTIPKKMDKASTLHETVRCLRIYAELMPPVKKLLTKHKGKGKGSGKSGSKTAKMAQTSELNPQLLSGGETLQSFLDAHDTFLIIISESGHILYATELITALLGHMQTRFVGQNIYNYIPETDKPTLLNMFDPGDAVPFTLDSSNDKVQCYPVRQFKCHFKIYMGETSSLTQHLPFICLSYLRCWKEKAVEEPYSPPLSPSSLLDDVEQCPLPEGGTLEPPRQQSCVLLLGKLPTNLTPLDLPLSVNDPCFSFDMRVSKNGNIISIDDHAVLILGYTTSEIVGSRFFDYIDPYHLLDVGEKMGDIFTNTRGSTNPYHFSTKGGRYVWLLSKGYLSYNPWNHKPDHILLSNRILGCDQVVPEFRFFRSRSLLPDVENDGLYNPPPFAQTGLPQQKTSTQQQPMWEQTVTDVVAESSSFLLSPSEYHLGFESSGGQQQQHIKIEVGSAASASSYRCGSGGLQNGPSTTSGAQQDINTQSHSKQGSGGQQQQGRPEQEAEKDSRSLPPNVVLDFQQEMERKNNELFEMQRRLLEQQRLMEQERNQFYHVAQQVMQYLGTSSAPSASLPPSLRLPGFPLQGGQTPQQMQAGATSHGLLPPSSQPSSHVNRLTSTSTASGLAGNFPQAYLGLPIGSEMSPFSMLMQPKKGVESNPNSTSPYSMLLAQSSVGGLSQGMPGLTNPAGQLPCWQTGATSTANGQQQQQRQEKSVVSAPTDSNPYGMLLGQLSHGHGSSTAAPGAHSQRWPLNTQQDKSAVGANSMGERMPFPTGLSQPNAHEQSTGTQLSGWTQQHNWPSAMPTTPSQQQQQQQHQQQHQGWVGKTNNVQGSQQKPTQEDSMLRVQRSVSHNTSSVMEHQSWPPKTQPQSSLASQDWHQDSGPTQMEGWAQQGWSSSMQTPQQQQQQQQHKQQNWSGKAASSQGAQQKLGQERASVSASIEGSQYGALLTPPPPVSSNTAPSPRTPLSSQVQSWPLQASATQLPGWSLQGWPSAAPLHQQQQQQSWLGVTNIQEKPLQEKSGATPSTETQSAAQMKPDRVPSQPSHQTQPQSQPSPFSLATSSLPFFAGAELAPGVASNLLPYQALASQLKMSTMQPHPSLQGTGSHPPTSSSSSSLSQSSSKPPTSQPPHQQHDSLQIRLPSDEEIQNLLSNIQMKCSSIP